MPLFKNGNYRIPKPFLRDCLQGKIDGREVVRAHRNTVFEEIHFAPVRGRRKDFFRDKKADGVRTLGCKFYKDTVGKVDFGKPFKAVGYAVKGAVEAQHTGLRG